MNPPNVSRDFISLFKRTLEEQLYNEIIEDYGYPRAITRSLVSLFFGYFSLYLGTDRAEGQITYRAIPAEIPPGIKMEEVKTKTIHLTINTSEDIEAISKGNAELVRTRIVRLTNEALDQGTLLTQADLCLLLSESPRTIVRRIQEIQKEGIIVPTRGSRKDIGPGISHKTKIVEMYLDGYSFLDIKTRTRHSSESITRYLKEFSRIMVLHCEFHKFWPPKFH